MNRVKEAGWVVTEKKLTETESVKALPIDDNNAGKGAPSAASMVIVDTERHITLVVAKGVDGEAAKRVFERSSNTEKFSHISPGMQRARCGKDDGADTVQAEEVKSEPSAASGGVWSRASAFCSDDIVKIVFGTENEPVAKKMAKPEFAQ